MDKITALILLFISSYCVAQCDDDYIKVVKDSTCQHVEMGVKTYADYYQSKKNLEEIKTLMPEIKDSLASLRKTKKKYEMNVDSLAALTKQTIDSLYSTKESWRNVSYTLESDLIETELKLEREERNRPKWFGGGALSILLILLLL